METEFTCEIKKLQEYVNQPSFNGFDVQDSKDAVDVLIKMDDILGRYNELTSETRNVVKAVDYSLKMAEKYQSELYDLECGLWTMGFFKRLKYLFNPYFISHEQFKGLSNKEISAYEESTSK